MAAPATGLNVSLLGQLFMVGLPELVLDDSTRHLIEKFRINNFIYFKRNVESPEQLKKLSDDLCKACSRSNLGPPLIAIDQEGGSVSRLPPPFTQFPDARVLAEKDNPEKSLSDYARVCASELREIGVNYNLAPVLDVCEADREYFMERRSLGGDPEVVGRLGTLVAVELQAHGVAACAKHFPGLGAAVADPHIRLPYVAKTEAELRAQDILPFQQAVGAGVASVMTSHTVYHHLDPEYPATLSKKILTGLLRNDLGYEGVIITDDLEMGAIEKEGDLGRAALQAFTAGADLLLICHSHEKVIDAVEKVGSAVSENPELHEKMLESGGRINAMREIFAK
ncbi:MAG: beta-N-acetylhexosaminidase [Deltaproteobacteria bacterium]|jgi:beta-N-acetylhexosaminidase|nr:beta-N-acetylhexosaminidase [Deltaproteobacteria bacterium]